MGLGLHGITSQRAIFYTVSRPMVHSHLLVQIHSVAWSRERGTVLGYSSAHGLRVLSDLDVAACELLHELYVLRILVPVFVGY